MFSKTKLTADGGGAMSPERRRAKIERRRRLWRKTGKILLWTLAVAFVAHLSLNIYASTQLNRELAAIRAKGEPLQYSELEPPAVPDAQNAALVYQQANKLLHLSSDEKSALLTNPPIPPNLEKLVRSAIGNNQKTLDLTRRAAEMPQCRFPLDWQGNPTRLRFPHYVQLRKLARLLLADARLKARSGDREVALSDVRALFGMSHHLSREPFLIGFLVGQAVNSLAHRALGETLDNTSLTVAQARELEASLPQDDWARAFRYSLVGERTFGIFAFEHVGESVSDYNEEENSGLPIWASSPFLWIARPVLKLDEVQTLHLWRNLLDSPESQQIPIPVTFDQAQDAAIQNTPFYAVLTKIYMPVFSQAGMNRDRAEVRRRQRQVALALTCFRTERGHYPASLPEAATLWESPLPLDPYSQKPFMYRSDGKTFVLYSIGVNRVDDGGKDYYTRPRRDYSADDIIWQHLSALVD